MNKKITAFLPYSESSQEKLISQLRNSGLVENIFLLSNKKEKEINGCRIIIIKNYYSTETSRVIASNASSEFILIQIEDVQISLEQFALQRFLNVAENTNAGILYSDYNELKNEKFFPHPLIDYQFGSLRDDFDFGSVLFLKTDALKRAIESSNADFKYAGFYDLRLKISRAHPLIRIPEFLYDVRKIEVEGKSEKQFEYVNPQNREVQIEMEQTVTDHLKKIEAFLKPENKEIDFYESSFPVEVSVIIPVRNRIKTIKEAVESALTQKADFNLIVVDNHSTDGTTGILESISKKNKRLIHLIPERKDLGIGGCWNEGIHHPLCGKFACQLDSDDLYKDENTLQKIIDAFKKEKAAMIIGSYILTDFNLNQIPPGIINHREWTEENGRNNALRINGLGAPRAFYTPIIRKINFPNVSYGEDYAVGLAISRDYKIGRIYEPIYYCRRWEENSDAGFDIEKLNSYNFYKDQLRTYELLERKKKNLSA